MIVEKIKEFLEKENKSLTDGFKFLLKQEYSQLSGFSFERQFLVDREGSSGDCQHVWKMKEGAGDACMYCRKDKKEFEYEKNKVELRFSSAGKCVRALAYGYHGFEPNGKEMDDRAYRTFFIGDMTETMIVLLAKAAGVPIFGYGLQQPKVSWKIADKEIHGHPDGFVIHEQGIYSLEIKSMNTLGYQRFESGDIDEAHLMQMNANMKACGTEGCLYVAFNKDNSVLGERLIPRSEELIKVVEERLRTVLESTKQNLPERPYKPNEKMLLPWQCEYCSHWKNCWPKAKEVLVGKAYRLQVPIDRNKEAEKTLISQSEL